MSYDVANNSTEYGIITESQLSIILSNLDIDLILSIIDDIITQRSQNYNFAPLANSPAAYENHFKQLLIDYKSEAQTINGVRNDAYRAIILKICERNGLMFNDADITDLYSAAYYIYDFLVANFNVYFIKFFTEFINREKNNIYEILNLDKYKKNKDSSALYSKKVYIDNKLAVISANLELVLNYICSYNIEFETILKIVYDDKNIIELLSSILIPKYDFFKMMYVSLFNTPIKPILFTNIRLALQQVAGADNRNIFMPIPEELPIEM